MNVRGWPSPPLSTRALEPSSREPSRPSADDGDGCGRAGAPQPEPAAPISSARDTIKVSLSGQVDRAPLYCDDGKSNAIRNVDDIVSSARFRLVGEGRVTSETTLGTNLEMTGCPARITLPMTPRPTATTGTLTQQVHPKRVVLDATSCVDLVGSRVAVRDALRLTGNLTTVDSNSWPWRAVEPRDSLSTGRAAPVRLRDWKLSNGLE